MARRNVAVMRLLLLSVVQSLQRNCVINDNYLNGIYDVKTSHRGSCFHMI